MGGVPDTSKCETFLGEYSHGIYMEKHTNLMMNPMKTTTKSSAILPTQESVSRTDIGVRLKTLILDQWPESGGWGIGMTSPISPEL